MALNQKNVAERILCAFISNPSRFQYIAKLIFLGKLNNEQATAKNIHKADAMAEQFLLTAERHNVQTVETALNVLCAALGNQERYGFIVSLIQKHKLNNEQATQRNIDFAFHVAVQFHEKYKRE